MLQTSRAPDISLDLAWHILYQFSTQFLYQAIIYPGEPSLKRPNVIVGSLNVGYDIYPTLPGIELTTCSIPSAPRFQQATVTDN